MSGLRTEVEVNGALVWHGGIV